MKTKLFFTGLALIAISSFASAQDPVAVRGQGNGKCYGAGKGAAFVDANKDGVCDNYKNRTANESGKNGKGYGRCNGTGMGQGKGKGRSFVDANKNGVCDNFEARTTK